MPDQCRGGDPFGVASDDLDTPTSISKRELRRSPRKTPLSALCEGDALYAAIEHLVYAGWLIAKETREGNNLKSITRPSSMRSGA